MSTVTISLPSQITKRVDDEAKKQGFATRSEFIRNLIRHYFAGETRENSIFQEFTSKPLGDVRSAFEKSGKYNSEFIESLMEGLSKSSVYENKATE